MTGGGTGGHFYPLIAVARSLKSLAEEEKLLSLELIYISDDPYDKSLLEAEHIKFLKISAGKMRRYFSIRNLFDPFKTFFGVFKAIWLVYLHYPDVIFAKGGYASFPTLFAARILRIPVLIHETDVIPGKTILWASKFAKRIAISFPESGKYFPSDKVALTGNPIREEIVGGKAEEARNIFGLKENLPIILVTGGSQGAEKINEIVLDILTDLLEFSQVIHQTGKNNFESVKLRSGVVLEKSSFRSHYHVYDFLDEEKMRNAYSAASLIVTRASGSIFEVAASGIPAILIPLPGSAQDHQRENAYSYARTGAAEVIEEENLTPHILLDRIRKLLGDNERREKMIFQAKSFSKPDASRKIAGEIIKLTIAHAS